MGIGGACVSTTLPEGSFATALGDYPSQHSLRSAACMDGAGLQFDSIDAGW